MTICLSLAILNLCFLSCITVLMVESIHAVIQEGSAAEEPYSRFGASSGCHSGPCLGSRPAAQTYFQPFGDSSSSTSSSPFLPPPVVAYSVSSIEIRSRLSRRLYKWHGFRCRYQKKRNERSQR